MIKSQQNDVKAICQLAAKQNIMVKPKGTKLIYNGRQYNHSDIGQLPEVISLAKAKTRVEDQFIAFVGPNAPLSNMYLSPIVDNGESFASVQHAFQAKKAEFANAPKIAALIRATPDPYHAKSLGKSVHAPGWESREEAVLIDLLMKKFTQHQPLCDYLINTGDRTIYEATIGPKWGSNCGLHSKLFVSKKTTGANVCGQALMRIRRLLAPHATPPSTRPTTTTDSPTPIGQTRPTVQVLSPQQAQPLEVPPIQHV